MHDIDFLCFGINRKLEQAGRDTQVTVTVLLTPTGYAVTILYTSPHHTRMLNTSRNVADTPRKNQSGPQKEYPVLQWTDVIYVKWFYCEVKWSEVKWSYGEVLGDKSTMHIKVTLYWGYLIVLWLFYLVCILYCGCFNLFCNMWVSVGGGFVMCGCFGKMCTCIYCVFVLFRLCIFILICFVCTSVRTTATEWQLKCSCSSSNSNNNMTIQFALSTLRHQHQHTNIN